MSVRLCTLRPSQLCGGAHLLTVLIIFVIASALFGVGYLLSFLIGARKGWRYVTNQSSQIHADVAKTMIQSAGIATAILSGFTSALSPVQGWAIVLLIVSILFGLFFVGALTRTAEIYIPSNQEEAELPFGVVCFLVFVASIALLCFLAGFSAIGYDAILRVDTCSSMT